MGPTGKVTTEPRANTEQEETENLDGADGSLEAPPLLPFTQGGYLVLGKEILEFALEGDVGKVFLYTDLAQDFEDDIFGDDQWLIQTRSYYEDKRAPYFGDLLAYAVVSGNET